MTEYTAFVVSDAMLTVEAEDEEHAKALLRAMTDTGDLGPISIKTINEDTSDGE